MGKYVTIDTFSYSLYVKTVQFPVSATQTRGSKMAVKNEAVRDEVLRIRAERDAANKKTTLIQGIFFQSVDDDIVALAITEDDNLAVAMRYGTGQFMFQGSIWEDVDNRNVLIGSMEDQFGVSRLSNIKFTADCVMYTKRYEQRKDDILYVFQRRDGDSWVGTYTGTLTGIGIARCWLREVPENHLYAEPLQTALGQEHAHRWFR